MKIIFKFFILLLVSAVFFSCSRDEVATGPSGSASVFNWSASGITPTTVSKISQGDADNLFIAGTVSCRISHGVQTQIDFFDADFTAYDVSALDSTYAVFLGTTSASGLSIIKIYDNGNIQTYNPPGAINQLGGLYVFERGKFFIGSYSTNSIFKFEAGTFFTIPLSGTFSSSLFGKVNNNFYVVTTGNLGGARIIYRIDGSAASQVVSESNQGNIFYLNNDFVKLESVATSNRFSYFTGTGWAEFYTYFTSSKYEFVQYLAGSSRSFFAVLSLDAGTYKAFVWNGSSFTQQSNFPSGISGSLNFADQKISLYNNNSFYFCYNHGASLLKAALAQ